MLKAHIYKSMTLNGSGCANCDEDHRRAFRVHFCHVKASKIIGDMVGSGSVWISTVAETVSLLENISDLSS